MSYWSRSGDAPTSPAGVGHPLPRTRFGALTRHRPLAAAAPFLVWLALGLFVLFGAVFRVAACFGPLVFPVVFVAA